VRWRTFIGFKMNESFRNKCFACPHEMIKRPWRDFWQTGRWLWLHGVF